MSMKRRFLMKRKRKDVSPKEDGIIHVKNGDMQNHVVPSQMEVREILDTSLSDPGKELQDYEKRQVKIRDKERRTAWDASARSSASPAEVRAGEIIWKIREDERDNLFGNKASEAIPGPETLDMGGQFLTNKNRIEDHSKLFDIAQNMPKGCHLHLHFNAELAPEKLISKAREKVDTMFIRSTQPLLTPEDCAETEVVFDVKPTDTPVADIFSPYYQPQWRGENVKPWMRWTTFKEEFEKRRYVHYEENEKKSDLDLTEEWVRRKMVLSEDEVYNIRQTTNGYVDVASWDNDSKLTYARIWARFNQATRAFKGLMNYESLYRWYVDEAIDNMVNDKVMYAEWRPMLLDKSIPSDDGKTRLDHTAQMRLIQEEVEKKQEQLKREGKLDKFPFGLKIIYCTPRSIPKDWMKREIEDCIKLKQAFPNLICGKLRRKTMKNPRH
jgi:adenosine deaminase CECR1